MAMPGRKDPRIIPLSNAKSLLNQIATGRVTDPDAIKQACRRVFLSLPKRDTWDPAPTGSTNDELLDMIVDAQKPKPKNKGGRPKGSKNKPKVAAPPPSTGGVL